MVQQRLPIVNSDDGIWGDIIRQYLMKEHFNDDTDNAANGGHKTITIRAGTATAGTAPLKFTSGTLLGTAEAGAVEFNTDSLYFTITTGTVRKKVALYDDSTGATGDVYYRNASATLVRLPVGGNGDTLRVSGGLPAWQTARAAVNTPTAVWGDGVNTASIVGGMVTYVRLPYSGTISEWHVVANSSCSCTLDVWKANNGLPTNANSITASAKPSLSSAATASSSTLTGWTTAVSVGDVIGFELESVTGSPSEISLVLKVV
jgi:hypothetical protein